MIKFKQKIFWGAVAKGAGMLAMNVIPSVVGGKMADKTQQETNKAQMEMQKQSNKQMAAQTKALNNLASAAKKNPGMGSTLAQAGMSGQKAYSIIGHGKIKLL